MLNGLKRGTVAVEPHRIEWEKAAQKIIKELKSVLQDDIIDAQHIGSTSIRGIFAKPIIDIVIGVVNFDRILVHNNDLSEIGIIYRGQDHPRQHLYVCGDLEKNIHTHYIHVVIWGSAAWNNYINMRDYLNSHIDEAKEYSDLKRYLAEKYPNDRNEYTNEKSEFISKILQRADEWKKNLQGNLF